MTAPTHYSATDHRTDATPAAPARTDRTFEYRRYPDETKPSFRTTEFFAYLATVAAIVITCIALDGGEDGSDPFRAFDALRYISWVTIGYMVARGLAKAGRSHHDDNR